MSPTTKRSKDDVTADGGGVPDRGIHGKPSIGHVGMTPSVPMVPQLIPGFPPGLQAMQTPVSFLPIPFGAPIGPGYPFGQPAIPAPTMGQHSVMDNTLKDTHNTKPAEPRTDNSPALNNQDSVKITPPEFFDFSKPFFYNGQGFFPVPAAPAFSTGMAGPALTVPMVNITPNTVPQAPGHRLQPLSSGAAASMPPPPPVGPVRNPDAPPVMNPIIPANANIQPQLGPPISSIKPSEITKKQISSFKQSLKYHEDQLQYNRHQIDEKDMESRIQTLRSHIQRFESTLKMQLNYEAAVLGQAAQGREGRGSLESPKDEQEGATSQQSDRDAHDAQTIIDSADTAHKRRVARVKAEALAGLQDFVASASDLTKETDPRNAHYQKRPTLPSDAALAPVFKPRFHSSSWGESPVNMNAQEAQAETEMRLLAAAG